jgi:hypothetical protein
MTELRGGRVIFDHTQADNADVLTRLRLIMSFKGGNPQVIDHGMQQLALIMIQGYERSQEGDRHRGVYNPLHDGSWDAPSLKAYLIRAINGFPCELLDSIMPVSMDDPLPSWC